MMGVFKNNHGIALVTSLMLTLITLVIALSLLIMVTQSINMSGQNKKYRTAVEASYGGAEILVKDFLPTMMQNYSSSTFKNDVQAAFAGVNLQITSDAKCLQSKLVNQTASWPSGCSKTLNAKQEPDIQMTLQATTGNPFVVSSKIVDTVAGNSDTSGFQLEGSGVAESSSLLTPKSLPYVYRLEVQGERLNNSTSQANLEIVYAY